MSDLPAVPGNDASTKGFEGFANKEESTGSEIFHGKHSSQPAPGNGSLPPGAKETPGFTKRTPSVTKRSYLKKIGD